MTAIEAETINQATVMTRDDAAPVARAGNYEAVRFNALKHGILSKLAVLAHEDHAEFNDLLAALIEEHRPAGRLSGTWSKSLPRSFGASGGYCWPKAPRSTRD